MKKMTLKEFCPNEEVQRMEDELRSLKLRDTNILPTLRGFMSWFFYVPKKFQLRRRRPCHLAKDCRRKSTLVCYGCGERGHIRNYVPKKNNPQGEEAHGRAYVIKEADKDQGPN
nr:hypothetical protein [Tanacetum cinerariifolium]